MKEKPQLLHVEKISFFRLIVDENDENGHVSGLQVQASLPSP